MDARANIIKSHQKLKEAMIQLNQLPSKESLTLFVVNENQKLVGSLTDGDIRRGFLNGFSLESTIAEVMNRVPKFLKRNAFSVHDIAALKEKEISLVPLLNDQEIIDKILDLSKMQTIIPVDAVLMAGGLGKRLHPLTIDTPKPLLHVGNKPIIERNVDRMCYFGIDQLYISVNYLGSKIRDYFGDGSKKNISIRYIEEKEPLGTIGSLSLADKFVHDHVLIMNSDLLTDIDFEDLYRTFTSSGADMIAATKPYEVSLPYGIIESENSRITSIREKPTLTYYSNAGIYIIRKEVLKEIPPNQVYNATDLMEKLIATGKKVINYPILSYWLDIGQHEDYKKAQEDIKHLKI